MSNLKQQLQKTERLAQAGKIARLINNPIKYIRAMLLLKLFYPITKRGSLKTTATFFEDNMYVMLPAATDIFLTGGKTHSSEISLAHYLIDNLKTAQTFLDIGAHFGYFSLLASKIVGNEGQVLSVEPAKASFELLSRNTHNKQNIRVLHNAISDKKEVVSFYEFPAKYSEYNAMDVSKFEDEAWMKKYNPEKTEVPTIRFDDLYEEDGLKPDMIKIDVEGAEVQAIKGGEKMWQEVAPIVIMEYLLEGGTGSSYEEATKILRKAGFASYMIKQDGALDKTDDIQQYMQQHGMTSENVVFKKDNK